MYWSIYELHLSDPAKYNPRALARKFGISPKLAIGVIKLMHHQEQMRFAGFNEDSGDYASDTYWRSYINYVMAHNRLTPTQLVEFEALESPSSGDAMISGLPGPIYKRNDWDLSPLLSESNSKYFLRTDFTGTWDVEFNPPKADWAPYQAVDDAYAWESIMSVEAKKKRAFERRQETLERVEAERYARDGSMFHNNPVRTRSHYLDDTKHPPTRHSTMLTETGDIRNASYQFAIRDKTGYLRGLTTEEFWAKRFQEKHPKAPFFYRRYRPHVARYPAVLQSAASDAFVLNASASAAAALNKSNYRKQSAAAAAAATSTATANSTRQKPTTAAAAV